MSNPNGVDSAFTQLREMMYEQDRGTWFSAVLSISKPNSAEIEFNFDDDPEWWPSVPPTVFLADLNVFPRSDEYIRPWLRDELTEAERILQQETGEHSGGQGAS
ncbi:hypothetical protein [Saccharopolyspora sp. NPDC002376]